MSSSDDDDATSPLPSSSDSASTSTAATSTAPTSEVTTQATSHKARSQLNSTSSTAPTPEARGHDRHAGSNRSDADDDNDDDDGGDAHAGENADSDRNAGTAESGGTGHGTDDKDTAKSAGAAAAASYPLQRWANTKDRQHLLDCNMLDVRQDPQEIQHLECFFATFTDVSDVTSIFARLTSLRIMIAPQITSVAGVEGCSQLTELWVCECGVDDIGPIGSLTKLKEVHLYDNHITSVLPLASCKELVNVDLQHNCLTDLSVLGALDRLEHVNVAHNALSQLPSSFANLPHLRSLNLAGNQIADFSALVALRDVPALQQLWLRSDDHCPNPVCHLGNYHAWVLFLLPHLTLLDDLPASSGKAKRRLSLQLEGKVVHTFALRHSLRAAAWLWAHDYMKSVYSMRNHFIKDIQVRVAAVKAVLEREQLSVPEQEQEQLRAYLGHLSTQGTRNDEFFESKTRALPSSHGLFEWRHNMLESFVRLIDTGYMHVHHSHLHPVDLSSVGTSQAQGAAAHAAWGASARQDVQAFFDRNRFKQFGVVACRVHHILQVENAHLSRQHDMAVQKFLMRAQEEEQFATDPARAATTASDGRIAFGRLSARPGRSGQTTTTAAAVAAASPSLARELTDKDVSYEYLMLDIGDARNDEEVDAAVEEMCSAFAGGSSSHRLTNRFHMLPHITSKLSSDHSWPPSHFTRVLIVRAYAPGVVWASARNGSLSCLQASEHVRRRRRHRAANRSARDNQQQQSQQQQGRTKVSRMSNDSSGLPTSTAPPTAPSNRSSRKATALRRRVAARARRNMRQRPREETLCEGEDDSTDADSDTEGGAISEAGSSGRGGGGGGADASSSAAGTATSRTPASDDGEGATAATWVAATAASSVGGKRASSSSASGNGDGNATDEQAEYTLPAGADVWFVPMYVMDVELCKNSLKLRPPKDATSTSAQVPESVHREWAQRKKLATAVGGALNASLLPRLDTATRVFGGADFASLTRLSLSGLGLQTVASLKGLPHLKHLNVGYNYLTSLAWTTALPALESLDVHHNRISSVDLGGPCKLRFLDLGANSITRALALTGLPVVCPALQCLFLNDNPFLESDAVGVLHKLAAKFADMRLITLEWSVVYRTTPLPDTPLPPGLEIRVSPFFKGEDRHVCAVWTSAKDAAHTRAASALCTAAGSGGEPKRSDGDEGMAGACGAAFACMHGSAAASYGGAPPWHSYRMCQELVVCNDCTDVGMLSRLAPPGVKQLRRPSVMNTAGFQTLDEYVGGVTSQEKVKGILVRASGPSTRPIVQQGVADFSAGATKKGKDALQDMEWLALNSCRLTAFKLPPSWGETLTSLSLVDNALGGLEFVQVLPSLCYLDVGHNEIQSLEDVASLDQLKTLLVSFNFVHDLSALQPLERLTTLYIDHNCISNPREVFHLRELKTLRVLNVAANAFCRKRNVVPFVLFYLSGRLTMLNDRLVTRADLDLAKRQFEGVLTVDVIADNVGEQQCEFVRTLDLPHCALREARLSDEMRFQHLYSLNLEDNAMTTLEPLAGLKFLRVLCLNNNRIRKFSSHRPRSADLHASAAFSSSCSSGASFTGGGSTLVRGAQGRLVRTNLSRNQGMSRSTSSIPSTFSSSSVPSSISTRAPGSPGASRRGGEDACSTSKTGNITARRNAHLDRALSPSRERPSSTSSTTTAAGRTASPLPRGKRGATTPPPQRRRAQSPLISRRSRPPPARQRTTNTSGGGGGGGTGVRGAGGAVPATAPSAYEQQQRQRQRQRQQQQHQQLGAESRSTSVAERLTDETTVFPSLEVLMLANNGIHKLGSLMLHRFPKLHTLFLQSNDISSTAGLADMPTLTALILDHNRIKTIAKDTLATCPKLRDLHVNSNRLQNVDQLSTNTQLQRVYMQSNRLAALEDLSGLKPHKRLRELVVTDNPFSRRRDSRLETVYFLPQVVALDLAPVTRAERQEAMMMFSAPEDMLDPLSQSDQQQPQQQQPVHKPIARKSSLPAIQHPPQQQQQQPQLSLTPQTLSFMSETLGTASTQEASHLQRHSSRGSSHTPMSASVSVAEDRKQRRFGSRERGAASSSSKRGRLSKIAPSLSRNHLPIKLRPLDKHPPRS